MQPQALTRTEYLRANEGPPVIRPVPRTKDASGRTTTATPYEGSNR